VTVSGAAVLGGTGTIAGSVTVHSSSATLVPGSPVSETADLATGSLTLNGGTTLAVQINGLTPDSGHDQVRVSGSVALGGATLNTTGSTIADTSLGDKVVLIDNDDSDTVTGTFASYPQGSVVMVNGQQFRIFYDGNDGNDVVLIRAGNGSGGNVNVAFVNEDWASVIPGEDPDEAGPAEAYLVDAYSTIQAAIDNVNPGGVIYVLGNSGAGYAGFDLNKNVQIRFIADYQNLGETTVTLNGAMTLSQNADWVLFDGSITGAETNTNVNPADLTTTAAGTINGDAANMRSLSLTSTTDGTGAVALGGIVGASQALSGATIGQTANRVASIAVHDLRAAGLVCMKAEAGDIELGSITADQVRLQTSGAIANTGAGNNVTASKLAMTAGSGIGSASPIETTVGLLAAASQSGVIRVANTGNLTIGEVELCDMRVNGVVAGAAIEISTTGNLSVDEPIAAGVGDATLIGGAAGAGAAITIDASVTASGAVTVLGGAAPDTITVNVTGASDITLDGRGGNDQYVVQLGGMGGGNVEIADSGNTNGDRATVYATEADERLTVNNVDPAEETTAGGTVYVGVAPVERVRYTGSLEFLTVMGEGGSDTFHVQPSRTAEITVNGGSPHFGEIVPPGGDMLDFDSFDNTFTLICGTILTDHADDTAAQKIFRPVHYRSIENMPLDPLGKTEPLRFDMNWTAAATQAGYTSVLPTTVYNASDPLSTFGWDAPLYGFDRGTTSFTSDFANLLRDGHWHSAMRTFSAEVESGWYLVSVKSGDKSFARDRLRVTDANTVSEADPAGRVLLDNVSSPAGQIVERTFMVFVPEGQNLALTFADLGGDPYWVVNGIEIRPGRILTFGSPETDAKLTADGVTQTTFTGYLATPGALVTVDPQLDTQGDYRPEGTVTIVSPPDADPDVAGHQVRANEVGEFTYTIVHPSVAGTMRVMYAEVTGAQASCFSVDFVAPSVRRFDFNSGASPTQAPVAQDGTPNGYVGVLPTQLTSPAVGYGWVTAAQGFDRGALTTTTYSNLLRDGAWGSAPRDFRMQLWPGTYDVTVTFGDASFARDQMNVTVVTGSVVSDLPNVTNVSTAAGQFVHRSFKASPTGASWCCSSATAAAIRTGPSMRWKFARRRRWSRSGYPAKLRPRTRSAC
jgi:hypothetical protein